MRLASRFGRINQIRRDRPLTHEELMSHVPSVFGSGVVVLGHVKYQSMYGTDTRLSLGIPAICCIRGNMTFVGPLNN